MKNEKRLSTRGSRILREPIIKLRSILIIFFIAFCLIIIIYHTYFETETSASTEIVTELSEFSPTSTINVFEKTNNTTTQLFNPSILIDKNNHYLLAFEKVDMNGTSYLWLTDSSDGSTWVRPRIQFSELAGAKRPYLEYFQEKQFRLFFYYNGKQYVSISRNGSQWSPPEPWIYSIINKSMNRLDDNLLVTNQTGLWISDFENGIDWKLMIKNNFTNSSITKVEDYEFVIVYENSTDNYKSFNLNSVHLKKSDKSEINIKWDLLILFIILGMIFLTIMVHEVARE